MDYSIFRIHSPDVVECGTKIKKLQCVYLKDTKVFNHWGTLEYKLVFSQHVIMAP